MTRHGTVATAAAALLWSLTASPLAHAVFTPGTALASAGYSSSTLQPPASVSATCASAGGTSTATVNWTASPSAYATGYRITSTPASTTTTAGGAARSATLTGLTKNSNYTFSVSATYKSWTSATRTTATVAC
jgi:hypothetical protein